MAKQQRTYTQEFGQQRAELVRIEDTVKTRGFVCDRERRDTEALFGFMKTTQAP